MFGALFIGLGVRGVVTTQRFLDRASAAEGMVVKVDAVGGYDEEGDRSYYPVVRFVTTSGRVVQYRDPSEVGPQTYRVGDQVRVLYDPANPQRARLAVGRWTDAMAKMIIGVLIFVVSGVVILVARESPRQRRGRRGKASVRGSRRRPRPSPPRSGAEPNRPAHREPAEERPQDSKVQDE